MKRRDALIRAAQYARMSTEHQQYSGETALQCVSKSTIEWLVAASQKASFAFAARGAHSGMIAAVYPAAGWFRAAFGSLRCHPLLCSD